MFVCLYCRLHMFVLYSIYCIYIYIYMTNLSYFLGRTLFSIIQNEIKYTSSTAQGGGGSFKNRKPIGEIGCCESGMAERSH